MAPVGQPASGRRRAAEPPLGHLGKEALDGVDPGCRCRGEMRHGAAAFLLERQARLGAVECLDLALLIDRQHDRMRRLKADNIAYLAGELQIVGQIELAHPVRRLQAMAAPDPLHRTDTDPNGIAHGGAGPVRGLARWIGQRRLPVQSEFSVTRLFLSSAIARSVRNHENSTVNRAPWFSSPRLICNSPPIRSTKDRIILIPSPLQAAGSNPSGKAGPSLETDSA